VGIGLPLCVQAAVGVSASKDVTALASAYTWCLAAVGVVVSGTTTPSPGLRTVTFTTCAPPSNLSDAASPTSADASIAGAESDVERAVSPGGGATAGADSRAGSGATQAQLQASKTISRQRALAICEYVRAACLPVVFCACFLDKIRLPHLTSVSKHSASVVWVGSFSLASLVCQFVLMLVGLVR
jgi:hypothetical protein